MNKFIYTILSIAILLFSSCGESNERQTANTPANTTPTPHLNDLHWLAGHWQMATPDGIIFEEWKIAPDSTLTALSGFINGTDTMISETIALQQYGDTIMYIPTVKDQNNGLPVPFKLTMAEGDSFVFENPQHDFPDKITYRKTSATSLLARISGTTNGTQHAETIEMNKIR